MSRGMPALDYLLKEVSFSTCSNEFFGELEPEMLVPSNVNIYGKIKNAESIEGYALRVTFSGDSGVGYVKKPTSNTVEDKNRILTYRLDDLINFDQYWWFPVEGETEFSLRLNLLPPFPSLNPVAVQISCTPDIAVGLQTSVKSRIRLKAKENVDQMFLRLSAPLRVGPGMNIAITNFSGDHITDPRSTVTLPRTAYPLPRLSVKSGESLDLEVESTITADPANLVFLRCEQDILTTKLLTLSKSTPNAAPCGVAILDEQERQLPVHQTIRSTVVQATGQIMYSPFSLSRDRSSERPMVAAQTTV